MTLDFTIVRASRYFKVYPTTENSLKLCRRFQQRYVHRSFSLEGDAPTKLYATALQDESEFRFHRNTLDRFLIFAKESLFKPEQYSIEDAPLPICKNRDIKIKEIWKIRDYQEPIIEYLTAPEPSDKFIGIQTGKGKSLALSELLRTPTGWVRNGDIQVGDEVIAKDGSITTVTGVYPQEEKQLYRVTFEDKRTIECCGEHLWKIYLSNNKNDVLQTNEISELLINNKVYIDLCDGYNPLDVKVKNDLYGVSKDFYNLSNLYFKDFDLFSKHQRLELIRGFLDLSSTVNLDGSIIYNNANYVFISLLRNLIWSIGGKAFLSTTVGKDNNSYSLKIVYKEPNELFKHTNKEKIYLEQTIENLKLRITNIESTRVEQSQCISISHPDKLYVTTNFIVTHNTFCSLCGVSKLGYRTVVIVEGGLVNKWASDILKVLDINSKRTLCVRGSSQLKGLISMAGTKEFENIDIILLSNTTLQDWISMHETMSLSSNKDIGYGVEPDQFYEKLEIGHRLIDEVHKKFHFNYKQDLYTNTHSVTSLSATLFSYDKVLESFYDIAYPKTERYNGGEIEKYTRSYAVIWRIKKGRRIKTKERGRSSYSHNAFEGSIMANKEFENNYFSMIAETIDIGFIKNYKPGNKVAIYVSSIAMATALTLYLQNIYKDKTTARYVGSLNDPYANLLDPDIRVTTLGSGGTGHDIPGLTDTILTVSIMSLQANIQVFGRTRFIADQDTRFYYFNCLDVEQQMKYHTLKVKLMEERAKSFEILNYYELI